MAVEDENGHVTKQIHEAFSDPDQARIARLVDADGKTWKYSYHALGRLATVVAPDEKERTWVYDSRNLLASETHPEYGPGTITYNEYDAAGNLKKKTDARGAGFLYAYDANDRLATILAADQLTTITYEPGSDRRHSATVGSTSAVFKDDLAGRLASREDTIDGLTDFVRFRLEELESQDVQYLAFRNAQLERNFRARRGCARDHRQQQPCPPQSAHPGRHFRGAATEWRITSS